ncbi:hypothetical protein QTH87_20360 [Variovorax sp. J22P168]|uniref:hypothetical protein n=1 Tax=Variovorax jilinensis TaxID=3053513 RepID=UPI0025779CBD|nr:hypothetical protein [Variovorax sp. J22P168]MDM0014809.1 hypothetical protein [Variovorax sp. J22P168]
MKTTELLDLEQALQLIEHVLVRGGDDGEHLIAPCINPKDEERGLTQKRLALRKTLIAATNLLTVAHRLMESPTEGTGKDLALRMKTTIERLKMAARGAYEAGHLLIFVRTTPRG